MKNKIPYWKSISLKFSLVIICGAALVVMTILLLSANRQQQNAIIYQDRKVERQQSFQIIADLQTQRLKGLTIENTYWDDMVKFIKKPTADFENNVLRAQLDSYKATAIWTYNTKYQLVSNTNNFNPKNASYNLGLDKATIQQLFHQDYYAHFYRQTAMGLYEVYGATVHDSSDPAHKTPNEGYFFIAKQIDRQYISDLEAKTKDQVQIETLSDISKEHVDPKLSSGIIVFYNDLNNEAGQRVARFKVSYSSAAIAGLFQSLGPVIGFVIAIYLALTIVMYLTLRRIIIKPITIIYDSLVSNKVDALDPIATKDTELGRIAGLIKKAEEQKDAISESAAEAQKAHVALEARTKELESINALMVDRELKMIELKRVNKELEQKSN